MSEFPPWPRPPVWRRALDRLVGAYNEKFKKQSHVFVLDSTAIASSAVAHVAVERFDRVEEVDADVWDALGCRDEAVPRQNDRTEMQAHGVLWVARLDGHVVGAAVSRRGEHFQRWFLPLDPDDVVIFRVRTLPPYRGRGIASALMRAIAFCEALPAGKAYVDCRVFNTPSIRMIEKAGFRRIATVDPLPTEEALEVAS